MYKIILKNNNNTFSRNIRQLNLYLLTFNTLNLICCYEASLLYLYSKTSSNLFYWDVKTPKTLYHIQLFKTKFKFFLYTFS